jgi:hypothetical protein
LKYFENFPVITYQGVRVKDITRRAEFIKSVSNNPYLHLPYTVKEGERPQDVALDYYGSVDYDWLVLLANNIIDPYYQWPLSDKDFKSYLIEKYTDQSGEEGEAVIDWLRDTTIEENVVYYYKPL